MVLRTYIFVDTTDRMDLTLGSSVIDRLLSLPLAFESDRSIKPTYWELNTIRGFLTGTALAFKYNICSYIFGCNDYLLSSSNRCCVVNTTALFIVYFCVAPYIDI